LGKVVMNILRVFPRTLESVRGGGICYWLVGIRHWLLGEGEGIEGSSHRGIKGQGSRGRDQGAGIKGQGSGAEGRKGTEPPRD